MWDKAVVALNRVQLIRDIFSATKSMLAEKDEERWNFGWEIKGVILYMNL